MVNNPPANAGNRSLADFTASVFHPSFSSLFGENGMAL